METHWQSVYGVRQLGIGCKVLGVMANIYEHLKEIRREQFLEDSPVSLHAEEISKGEGRGKKGRERGEGGGEERGRGGAGDQDGEREWIRKYDWRTLYFVHTSKL